MSAFEEFWVVEEDGDGDYDNMKDFAKTYWDAAIKFMEEKLKSPNTTKVETVTDVCDNSLCKNWSFSGCKRKVCEWADK